MGSPRFSTFPRRIARRFPADIVSARSRSESVGCGLRFRIDSSAGLPGNGRRDAFFCSTNRGPGINPSRAGIYNSKPRIRRRRPLAGSVSDEPENFSGGRPAIALSVDFLQPFSSARTPAKGEETGAARDGHLRGIRGTFTAMGLRTVRKMKSAVLLERMAAG